MRKGFASRARSIGRGKDNSMKENGGKSNSILMQIIVSLVSGIVGALISSYLVWTIAIKQIGEARNASQGQLIVELNRDFSFNSRMYGVRKAIDREKPIFIERGGKYTTEDIDDYLGLFELMRIYEENGILDHKLVDDSFGVFVEDAYKNKEIRQYITDIRKEYKDDGLYSGFMKWGQTSTKNND